MFNRTTVADILAAKHSLYTYWGSNHWCDADGHYIFISVWAIGLTSCFCHSPGEGCRAKGGFILILVWAISMTCFLTQMNSQDVGALLVMDRAVLDADGDEIVTEAEFRASPQTGAMRGIVTERDYLRAVARGAVAADTKGERRQSPCVNSLPCIVNHPITTQILPDRPPLTPNARVSPSIKVSDIMTDFAADDGAGLISASPDTSVLAAVSFFFNYRIGNATEVVFFVQMEIMTERRIRHIPCIVPASKDGRTGSVMEGMVCIGDVVKALLAEEREEVQICRDFINGVYD